MRGSEDNLTAKVRVAVRVRWSARISLEMMRMIIIKLTFAVKVYTELWALSRGRCWAPQSSCSASISLLI